MKNENKVYLGNAFSLQMLGVNLPSKVKIEPVNKEQVANSGFTSIVGHCDTAAVLSNLLGVSVAFNRESVKLHEDDVLYVAQIVGGRLPEGTTTLPEGFEIQFLKVTIEVGQEGNFSSSFLATLEKTFNERYKYIYDNDDNVPGYREAVNAFDGLLDNDEIHTLIKEFCGYRQDFISSDRETAAFVMALRDMKYIE